MGFTIKRCYEYNKYLTGGKLEESEQGIRRWTYNSGNIAMRVGNRADNVESSSRQIKPDDYAVVKHQNMYRELTKNRGERSWLFYFYFFFSRERFVRKCAQCTVIAVQGSQ